MSHDNEFSVDSGLFEKIGDDKDDEDMQQVRREMRKAAEESGEKGKKIVEFIMKNFNEFRVSDGLPDSKLYYHSN